MMQPTIARDYLTSTGADNPLTGSYVYSEQFAIDGCAYHQALCILDPDENDEVLDVIAEVSPDPMTTPAASSEWIQLSRTAVSAGAADGDDVEAFTVTAAAAGTKVKRMWDMPDASGQKMRIGVKDSFSGAGSNRGNARVVVYSRSS